jgi:hypothetical protein
MILNKILIKEAIRRRKNIKLFFYDTISIIHITTVVVYGLYVSIKELLNFCTNLKKKFESRKQFGTVKITKIKILFNDSISTIHLTTLVIAF